MLNGAVQKGPFVIGSSMSLSVVDAKGNPTGKVFNTQTIDNLGRFSITVPMMGALSIQGDGFYFDELTGALSSAPITLRSWYDVTKGGTQPVFVNLVTHLSYLRVQYLLQNNVPLATAIPQAEGELVAALGLGGAGFTLGSPGSSLDILGQDNNDNAYLFALSAVMEQAALEKAGPGGSVDAALQQMVDQIGSDLAQNGTLPASWAATVKTAAMDLDVDLTTEHVILKLAELGSSATVANLDRVIDTDGDGIVNITDNCPLVANPAQQPVNAVCRVKRWSVVNSDAMNPTLRALIGNVAGSAAPDVVALVENQPSLLINDGTGVIAAPVPFTPPVDLLPDSLVDVDGDGKIDFVYDGPGPAPTGKVSGWAPGDGQGHFGAFVSYDHTCDPCLYADSHFADFDGDAVPDLVRFVDDGTTMSLAFSHGMGAGKFAAPILTALPFGSHGNAWPMGRMAVADANGDGALDVLARGTLTGTNLGKLGVFTLAGDGHGHFAALPATIASSFGAHDWNFAAGDVDGDGHVDAVIASTEGINVLFGDGLGGFGAPVDTGVDCCNNIIGRGLAVADFTGDGKADVAVAFLHGADLAAHLAVLVSQGTSFAAPQALRTGFFDLVLNSDLPGTIASGDLNGDGKPDLVVALFSTKRGGSVEALLINP
jgi:hypothetical protein